MKIVTKLVLALSSTLLCASAFAGFPSNSDPTTFLGPTARVGFSGHITDVTAYNIAGEMGWKNYRIGMTLGWLVDTDKRLKFTTEFLRQKITYGFTSGKTDEWVNQGAIGGVYEYDLVYTYNPTAYISGYISHAPSKQLGANHGSFIEPDGTGNTYENFRRIAGSNANGLSPGVYIHPLPTTKLGVELNYDNVRYDKKYAPKVTAQGFGGTLRVKQALTRHLDLDASAAIREPFNDYEARLAWKDLYYKGRWTVALYGNYLAGHEYLPNTWNIGLAADYFFDPCPKPANLKGELDLKAERMLEPTPDRFLDWVADPAVHMPQVLAIADQVTLIPDPTCTPAAPRVVGFLTPLFLDGGALVVVPAGGAFSGAGLTYSVVTTALPAGSAVTINPGTGAVTVTTGGTSGDFEVTVTATGPCGSVTSSFPVFVVT